MTDTLHTEVSGPVEPEKTDLSRFWEEPSQEVHEMAEEYRQNGKTVEADLIEEMLETQRETTQSLAVQEKIRTALVAVPIFVGVAAYTAAHVDHPSVAHNVLPFILAPGFLAWTMLKFEEIDDRWGRRYGNYVANLAQKVGRGLDRLKGDTNNSNT